MTVFHAIYHVLVIYHHMPHNSCSLQLAATWAVCKPFVEVHFSPICYSSTACYTVCYLLPRAVQFVICCYMPYSLLVVAACHTVCYLLLHTIYSLLTCCRTPYSFLICCRMPYSLPLVATCHMVCYLLPHAVQFFISVAACCIICYLLLHAVQFAISCRMLYSLLFVATCRTVAI